MQIVNLASGSKANSTFVKYENTKLLIDVGLSLKELSTRLSEIGENLSEISAVLITHEHVDHIKGLKMLAKKYDTKIYVHQKLYESHFLDDYEIKPENLKIFVCENFFLDDICITPFKVSHDAIFPVGFVLGIKNSASKVGFLTDVGEIDENVINSLSGVKMLFIESNYDSEMLSSGYYPFKVKQRIAGKFGHLSNSQSLDLASKLYKTGTRCFILSHLSKNNNLPQLAFANYSDYFKNQGLILDKDVFIRLSFQEKHGNNFNLKEEFYE